MTATLDRVVYSSATNAPHTDPTTPDIEVVVSKTLRVNDPGYGIKAAQRQQHERIKAETERAERAEFSAQRAAAVERYRANERAKRLERITALHRDYERIKAQVEAKTFRGGDGSKVLEIIGAKIARQITALDALGQPTA